MAGDRRSIGFSAMNADVGVVGIFVVLVFVVLHVAGYFFAPLLAAIVLGLLLSRIEAALERKGLPPTLAAAVLMLAVLAGLMVVLFGLIQPLSSWIERTPILWFKFHSLVDALEEPLRDLTSLRENVRAAFTDETLFVVEQRSDDQVSQAVSAAPALAGQVLIFIGALFFFLAGRRELKSSLITLYSNRADQLRIARLISAAEYSVSFYLAAVASINLVFGLVVSVVMMLFGLPEPLLWGTLAFALNFIPYLGPAIMTLLIFGAGLMTFPGLTTAFIAAGTYVALNVLEGQFITPSVIGRSAALNPFLVFCSLAFGLWFWGAIGAFLAVPLLLILRAVATHSRGAAVAGAPAPADPETPG